VTATSSNREGRHQKLPKVVAISVEKWRHLTAQNFLEQGINHEMHHPPERYDGDVLDVSDPHPKRWIKQRVGLRIGQLEWCPMLVEFVVGNRDETNAIALTI
jgi:hypothetical protein